MTYGDSLGVNDIHRWVEADGDGFILMSPVGDGPLREPEAIDSAEPPIFLMEHPRLAEGASYLQMSMGHALLRMVYTAGESKVEHLSAEPGDDAFEQGLNGDQSINVVAHTVDGVQPIGPSGLMELVPEARNAYTDRVATAALMAGASALYAGLEVDPHSQPLGITERRLHRIAEIAAAQARDLTNPNVALAAEIVARNSFQWYRALSLTQQFKKLRDDVAEEAGRPYPGGIMMLAPVKDLAYSDKFNAMANSSMEASMYPLEIQQGIVAPDSDTRMIHLQRHVMFLGRLTYEHLDTAEEIRAEAPEPLRPF